MSENASSVGGGVGDMSDINSNVIEAVKARPFLYDQHNPCYHQKDVKEAAFEEIGAFLGIPGNKFIVFCC